MLFEKQRIIFIHINKTGGGSVEKALLRKFTGKKKHANPDNERGYGHHHPLRTFAEQGVPLDEYFKFTVIRNPWDKMVSLYWFRRQGGVTGMRLEGAEQCSFKEWIGHIRPDRWRHICQYEWLCDDQGIFNMDFVMRFETLRKDWETVCLQLGWDPIPLPHIHQSKLRPRAASYREFYKAENGSWDMELIDQIGALYAKDMEHFGYQF